MQLQATTWKDFIPLFQTVVHSADLTEEHDGLGLVQTRM